MAPEGSPSVVLIGPMASGKSRIGRRVAKLLGEQFTDTDKMVVADYGPIPTIFADHGETAFRLYERDAVAQAVARPGVVSLGGGAVLDASTQRLLEPLPVVLLMSTPEAAEARLKSATRPVLGDGGIQRWVEVLEQRRPIYERLARVTFDTSSLPADAIARDIAGWARERTA